MQRILALALITLALGAGSDAWAKGPQHCPPGLAKKNPACVPPGQAKKAYRAGKYDKYDYDERDYRDIRVGDRVVLNGEEYVVVRAGERIVLRRDDDLFRLPRHRADQDYVRVGNVIVAVDRKTKAVFDIIELADLVLN